MLQLDYINILHNIKEEYVDSHQIIDGKHVLAVQLPVIAHACPKCNHITKRVKDYYTRTIKLGTIRDYAMVAKYRQRRYHCQNCGHTFAENNPLVSRYMQVSKSNIQWMYRSLEKMMSFTSIAEECNVSISTVIRLCDVFTIPKPTALPTVISIDEFKGNAGNNPFQVNITNPVIGEVLDILLNRDTETLMRFFQAFLEKSDG